ncbi:MAG: hypothetical protein D6677_10355 [Calditrichaeota bacterium]|nr:MAG: hypothetical protein D6677_10355 [Calditrichota bacterium]
MFERAEHQKQMRILWLSMFSTAPGLSALAVGLFYISPESLKPLADYRLLDQVVMTAVLFLVIGVIGLKRSLYVADKQMSGFRLKTKDHNQLWTLCRLADRKYQLILWIMGELIALLAFIIFVFSGNLSLFAVYMLVGGYVLAVNFPTGRFLDRCQYILESEGE